MLLTYIVTLYHIQWSYCNCFMKAHSQNRAHDCCVWLYAMFSHIAASSNNSAQSAFGPGSHDTVSSHLWSVLFVIANLAIHLHDMCTCDDARGLQWCPPLAIVTSEADVVHKILSHSASDQCNKYNYTGYHRESSWSWISWCWLLLVINIVINIGVAYCIMKMKSVQQLLLCNYCMEYPRFEFLIITKFLSPIVYMQVSCMILL